MARFGIRKTEDISSLSTPFYYYDMDLLKETINEAKKNADKYGYYLHYAVKANSEDRILKEISSASIGADCVSGWEIEKSIQCGFKPENIVFAGVGKSDKEILYAIENGIFMFNVESLEEIDVINSFAKEMGKTVNISFRVNPEIKPQTHKFISTGHKNSKFGISKSDIPKAVEKVKEYANITLLGIHMHIGSQILNMEFFEEQAIAAAEVIAHLRALGCNIKIADMGGGLGIDYENPDKIPVPDFQGYFKAYHDHMPKDIQLHFELGRAMVAQCGELITKVLYTKESSENYKYIIVDAGMTDLIRPALYGAKHKIENITEEGRPQGIYTIAGPICESSDIFAESINFPQSKRGDILTIRSAGAYGSIMSSHYNLRPTAQAVYSEDLK